MILNFSSFVELFAAIYVTMAVNNDFCSNFWTPRYYKEMELLLKTYDFSGSSSIHDKLMDEIKVKYEVVQNRAHFRGFILLTLCVCYLVFMGYENESNSQIVGHYVPLLYSTIIVGFTILFSGVLLTNWRRTIFASFSLYTCLCHTQNRKLGSVVKPSYIDAFVYIQNATLNRHHFTSNYLPDVCILASF